MGRAPLMRRVINSAGLVWKVRRERQAPFWPVARLKRVQRRRLQWIVRHAFETVPFYRRAIEERGLQPEDFSRPEDLARLPLLDDLTVRRNAEQFLSQACPPNARVGYATSGAYSRTRKLIYWDRQSVLDLLAWAERDRQVLNALVGKRGRQVQLYLLPQAAVSSLIRKFWETNALMPRSLARRHSLSTEAPFEEAREQINALRPDVVFSYGSYAEEFFRYLLDQQLDIVPPRVWMYGGDTLSRTGRRLMEERFGCRVYTTYQTVETGKIGFQCERREGLHLNVDICPVRLVDEEGQTVKAGEPGEIVVSNLCNRAMVLLNYRLGDLGVMSTEPCPCGRTLPVLSELQGKVNEILTLPDGRRLISGALEMLVKDELAATLQAQLVQRGGRELLWRIVPFSGIDPEPFQRTLREKTLALVGEGMEVVVEFVEDIPRSPTGKRLRLLKESRD